MKKFTFMLLAAFIAVSSWAQPTAVKNRQLLPEQFAVKTATTFKQAPQMKKEMAPRPALKAKVQAPVQRTMKKAKAGQKKAIDFTALLSGEPMTFLVKNYAYGVENQGTEEEPDYQLVPVTLPRLTEFWTVTLDATTMTVSITGIGGGETAVTGNVYAETMSISIPSGQPVGTTTYGTIGLAFGSGAENLVGQFTGDAIIFNDVWCTELIDGDYAGYTWSDYYVSTAVLPNGKMAWGEEEVDVAIDFDAEAYLATVWNFGDEGVAIDVTLKPEGKFVIESQLAYEGGSQYGDFYTYNADCNTPTITGTGTENTLIFGSTWTCYAPTTGYWFGEQQPATITFDGTFVYPEIPDTPATPAAPEVTFFDFWNGESATVTLNVPCVDVDGNDIKGSLLSYQLFTMDDAGAPVALGEAIAYDSEANGTGDVKTVVLGEEAKNLIVIGAKSIYTAGGETNESEIAWFEIPQVVVVPEGLEVKEYPVTADAYSGSWTTYTGTALVGVDGTDIYVKGIMPHCPEGWVKGTIEDGVATFPVQCIGTYNGSVYLYFAAYDSAANGLKEATFTYNADENFYVTEDILFANSNTEKLGFYYPYFDGMTIGTETIPELIELPEGAEVVEYPFVGTTYSSSGSTAFESKVNVAVVGDDVYVQGLNSYVPETWVKGTKDAETGYIIFPTGQNLGVYEYNESTYQFFMIGYDNATEAIADVVMTYNEKQNFYRLENDLLVNGKKLALNYYKWYEAGSTIGIQTEFTATFNFNAMDVPTSSNVTTDGDITEPVEFAADDVTLTISPKAESATTQNRFWGTSNGPQLRVYSGTLTFTAPEGFAITQIAFNHNGKWGANTVNEIAIPNDAEAMVATWTPAEGEEPTSTVVVAIAANSQINSIEVTTTKIDGGDEPGPEEPAIDPDGITYTFEDGTLQGWTTIDADGDGYNWAITGSGVTARGGEDDYAVFSQSYDSNAKALTPDNYLVSPKIKLGSQLKFYAVAQDASYPEEHFGVAVSTTGKNVADFAMVDEWDLKAVRHNGPRKVQGTWYEYIVDMSKYEGEEGYVAIRHFNCTDMFYIVVDDITFGVPAIEISPEEGVAEQLGEFILKFNKYQVVTTEETAATLLNETTGTSLSGTVTGGGDVLTVSFEATTEPGDYTMTVTGVQTTEGEPVELSFNYTIKEPYVLVELPEGIEPIEYTLVASGYDGNNLTTEATMLVAFDGTDVYLQGLAYYFPESFVKGTLNEDGTVVVPSGQFVGEDSYGPEFLVGLSVNEENNLIFEPQIVFNYDSESGVISLLDETYFGESSDPDAASLYNYFEEATYTPGAYVEEELVVLPEGVTAEQWALEGFFNFGSEGNDVARETEVAFDGNDVYVKGLPYYFEDSWLKGTLDAETGIITFPTGQFVGKDDYGKEYMHGFNGDICDIQYAYNAETKVITQVTPYVLESGSKTGFDDEGELTFWGYWEVSFFHAGELVVTEPVEVPEDLVTETYLFSAMEIVPNEEEDDYDEEVAIEEVYFNFNAMDILTSSNESTDGDITEDLTLTESNVTLTVSPKEDGKTTENRFWGTANGPQLRVYSGTLTFEVPEGITMTQIAFNAGKWNEGNSADNGEFDGSTWTGDAQAVVVSIAGNTQINSIVVSVAEEGGEPEPAFTLQPYEFQIQVGIDGQDVYFKGFTENTAEMWAKGTLTTDGTVVIPASQYMGFISALWSMYDYYLTALGEDGSFNDIVLNYDAETNTFSTDQTVALNGSKFVTYTYQTFQNVVISKMPEFAATPADPSIDSYKLEETSYPWVAFTIPAEDVEGNALLASKLFYTVWIEEEGEEKPFVVLADEYKYIEEDITEIPYEYDDSYDIYRGGSRFYINPATVVPTWKKIGIQSIYYGGDECNKSNIVWMDNPSYDAGTGISSVLSNNQQDIIFNLAGQRVQKAQKGIYIMNGKKVLVK